jgi:peroxiredoxin
MTIKVGEKFPSMKLKRLGADGMGDGMEEVSTDDLFAGKKTVLFSVPGAFTPTCSAKHLPGFVNHADKFKAKGVEIVCTAVNDAFVMKAWGKQGGAEGKLAMLPDGNASLAKALGLELDGSGFGMGTRGQRFAIFVDNGVVKDVQVEAPGQFEVSSAEYMLNRV